ncbi:sugar phosphate isomerase/epimerase family protein [Streptomyces sp. BPPL-273]|nr:MULTISPECIES: sugar phosphate isomerase/epimerase family protein [Streptomyces]MCQ4198171.1 sugar phosphate isomerase/epimerase [Streptomyces parvulus]WHM35308.1 sugar phosphate isomerase/epimerase family protein [Streptomyces sp. BPPL-273]WML84564.1 sugar phosphate isomerase/epimerase family protein [Streptomyces sp. VNUA74]
MTVKQLTLPELTAACRDLGVGNVGLWREPVRSYGVEAAAKLVRDAGLTVTTLCRGGFLTAVDPDERAAALADNRRAVDEAAALGTDTLVLVSGGLPAGHKDLRAARERIADALAELGPYAERHGVRLAIEPLHPMFAADRCVVSTLAQALDLAERFPAHQVGVTVDTYHVWWDDRAPEQIARAGAGGRIHTFQLADWTTPLPEGVLNGRGQIGDGAVDMREWKGYVEAAGYTGAIEVELFNEGLWARDGREVLAETAARFAAHAGDADPEEAGDADPEK